MSILPNFLADDSVKHGDLSGDAAFDGEFTWGFRSEGVVGVFEVKPDRFWDSDFRERLCRDATTYETIASAATFDACAWVVGEGVTGSGDEFFAAAAASRHLVKIQPLRIVVFV